MNEIFSFHEIRPISAKEVKGMFNKIIDANVGVPNDGIYGPYTRSQYSTIRDHIDMIITGISRSIIHPINSEILPITLVTNQYAFEVVIRKLMGATTLTETPELANTRSNIEQVDSKQVALRRYANGGLISTDLLNTEEGRNTLIMKMVELAEQTSKTLSIVAFKAIAEAADNSIPRFSSMYELLQHHQYERHFFGLANKTEKGLLEIITTYRVKMQNNAGNPVDPTHLLLPFSKYDVAIRDSDYTSRAMNTGDQNANKRQNNADVDTSIQGLKIIKAPLVIDEKPETRLYTIGSFIPIYHTPEMRPNEAPTFSMFDPINKCYSAVSCHNLIMQTGMFYYHQPRNVYFFRFPNGNAMDSITSHPLLNLNTFRFPALFGDYDAALAANIVVGNNQVLNNLHRTSQVLLIDPDNIMGVPVVADRNAELANISNAMDYNTHNGDAQINNGGGALRTLFNCRPIRLHQFFTGDSSFIALLVMPHQTYEMDDLYMVHGGDKLGFTARSITTMDQSVSAHNNSFAYSYAIHTTGVVLRKDYIQRIPAAFYNKQVCGMSTVPMTRNDANILSQSDWRFNREDDAAAYSILIPKSTSTMASLSKPLHVRVPARFDVQDDLINDRWRRWYYWNNGMQATYTSRDRIACVCFPDTYKYTTQTGIEITKTGSTHNQINKEYYVQSTGFGVM